MNEEQRVEVVESYVKRVAERAGEYWNRALDSGVAMAIKLAMEKELDVMLALAALPSPAAPSEGKENARKEPEQSTSLPPGSTSGEVDA